MIKLIASDLDGTLLHNNAQTLDPHVFDLISELKKKGIHFAASSGRQYANIRRMFWPIRDDISYIAENGSLCIHNGEVLSRGFIERGLGLRIVQAIHARPHCETLLSCESVCYTDSRDPEFVHHIRDVMKNDLEVVNDLSEIAEPFLKIAVCNFKGTQNMGTYFEDLFRDEIRVVTSGNIWLDFIAPNANKGTALAGLLEYLHISPEECIAFGDQYNDVEMLQLAGTSYAMSNAAPGIAYYSTYVTDSVEEVLYDLVSSL